ncbi:MAG TPA: hypothetical protein VMV39_02995, partial [Terracidiphilus sp.]|nr:hypothetical protein [Terracidiphilus sp.]
MTLKNSQLVRLVTDASGADASNPNALREGGGKALFGLDAAELAAVMTALDEPSWRGRQLAQGIYHQIVAEISEITTLAKSLRQKLTAADWQIGRPEIAQVFKSVDGTERYLVEFFGG